MNIFKLIKLPDLVTLLSVAFALLSIFSSINLNYISAAIFMFLSAAADYCDGIVARLTKRTGEFGKQMDSLADIVAFGVAPAVFGYMLPLRSAVFTVILVLFVCAGLLRLARFNSSPPSDYFEGLPITASGIIIPGAFFLYIFSFKAYGWGSFSLVMEIIYLALAVLMISSIKIKKLKPKKTRNKRT